MTAAREKALAYLGRFARTEQQVAQYLSRKGFSSQEISDTIAHLRQYRLVDDDAFANGFIRSRIRHGDGPLKIRQMLLQKGIGSARIRQLLAEAYPDELQQERIEFLLKKRLKGKKPTGEQRVRLQRFIASRGFPRYVIIQTFKHL